MRRGWASYGLKFELWNRLCRAEAHAVQQAKEIEVMGSRQRALERRMPVAATTLPVPQLPDQSIIDAHNRTHLPTATWCATCQLSKSNDLPHLRVGPADAPDVARAQMNYMFLRSDMSLASAREAVSEGFKNMWATTLVR